MAKSVYTKEERHAQFLKTGLKLARKRGVGKVSISSVAKEHEVTAPLVFHIFGSRAEFHAAIIKEAKKQKIVLPADAPKLPPRKRSIKEVRAIKNKVAAKKPAVSKTAKKNSASASKRFTSLPVPTGEAAPVAPPSLTPKI